MHPLSRIAFAGLWTLADFKGCLEWRPRRIKLDVLPYDDFDMEVAAAEMEKAGLIYRYEVGGKQYIKIITFTEHQNPHKQEREAGSKIPDYDPSLSVANTLVDEVPNNIGSSSEVNVLIPDSLNLIPDSLSGENPPQPKEKKPTLESLTVTDELRTWAKDNGISADLDLETEQWRDHHRSAGTKIKDAKASWRKWMRNTLKFSQSKLTTTSNGNGYDPTKDIMHPDYKIEKPRKTFTEAADHVLDNMPDKYEEMKVNWLTMPWVKGYEYEIEEYERSSPRYQRYCETRQALASASVN